MNDFVRKPKGKIRIYASGGCGANIGSMLEKHRNQNEAGFADLDIVYVDTSLSNFRAHVDQTNAYLIEGLDGSGKVRSENSDEIHNRVRAILQQFKPADLNIILSSAAGGSGSVIGPLLTRELLNNDASVVVLAIGSTDTRLDTENTLKTLKSYEAVAQNVGKPVVMAYVQNSKETTRDQANTILFNSVMGLAVLFSRENHELDARDLYNLLHFNNVTTFPVQLASLIIVEDIKQLNGAGSIISVGTVAKEGAITTIGTNVVPEYQCVGFLPPNIGEPVVNKSPLHFVITDGIIPEVCKNLQTILNALEQEQAARVKKAGILTNKDVPDKTSGLIL